MIRIFKMKKVISICMLIISIFLLTSCGGNKVTPNQGEIIFSFPEEYIEYLPYSEVPTYTFTFEGNLNTIVNATTSNKKVFGKNDDFVFSDILRDLFNKYEEKDRITYRVLRDQEAQETRMNILVEKDGEFFQESQKLKVENDIIYEELAFISLENGLTLSCEYRRFDSIIDEEFKTLITWKYTTPLNIVLQYPIILNLNENGEKEILLTPIPPNVIYHLGISDRLLLSTILEKDTYLNEYYRSFYYPDYNDDPRFNNDDFNLEANIELVKEYYIRDANGRMDNDEFYFTYLDKDFKITFKETTFIIDYIKPIA